MFKHTNSTVVGYAVRKGLVHQKGKYAIPSFFRISGFINWTKRRELVPLNVAEAMLAGATAPCQLVRVVRKKIPLV